MTNPSGESLLKRCFHAAHYSVDPVAGVTGHDLLVWTVQTRNLEDAKLMAPDGFKYAHGNLVRGVQYWTFNKIAPMSPGSCEFCRAVGGKR